MNNVRCLRNIFVDFSRGGRNINLKKITTRNSCICARNYSSCQDNSIVLRGWVQGIRQQKYVSFIKLNDGRSLKPIQIVVDPEISLQGISYGSCIQAEGELVDSKGRQQEKEFLAKNIQLIGECDTKEYPLKAKQKENLDQIRKYIHLRPRSQSIGSMIRIRNAASMAVHKYFQDNGYSFVHTPILTSNDCEGAGETFTVEPLQKNESSSENENDQKGDNSHFFGVPAHLTVSGQLHLEAVTGAFSKAYNFSPTFRAEKSNTRHHLSEFYMIEAELAFTHGLEDIMQVMEDLVKSTTSYVLHKVADDVEHFFSNAENKDHKESILSMLEKEFIRLSYTDAIQVLEKKFPSEISWGEDLAKKYEKYIVEHCGNTPVFLTDFPKTLKPFYSRENDDGITTSAVDLLVPGVGELCGGTMREERYHLLNAKLEREGLKKQLSWYLDLRKFGSVPHGGFGMGFDRFLQYILSVQNIRDISIFPRFPQSCKL